MQVIPVSPSGASNPQEQKAASTRDKAINAFLNPKGEAPAAKETQPRDLPVQNANKVDVQELSHLTPQGQISPSEGDAPAETAAPLEPKAPSVKEDPALSSQYAALARREKAIRAQRLQLEQDRRAWDASKATPAAPQAPQAPAFDPNKFVSLEDLQKDPFAALAKTGLSYEQLTQLAMNAPAPEEVKFQQLESRYEAKIKALEERLDGTNKAIKEQETAAYQGALNQIRADVTSLINKDPAFETIKVTGQHEEVVKLIESVYKDGMGSEYPKGTVLDHYEAAKMVEDEIAESLYQWTSKASRVASRFKPQQQVAPAAQAQKSNTQQTGPSQQARTLTNQMNSSKQLSPRERAILAAEGKLGK